MYVTEKISSGFTMIIFKIDSYTIYVYNIYLIIIHICYVVFVLVLCYF